MAKSFTSKQTRKIVISEETFVAYCLSSLQYSALGGIDEEDFDVLYLSAKFFLQLRDFSITDEPFSLIYDFVQLFKNQQRFLSSLFLRQAKRFQFDDVQKPEGYRTGCLFKLLSAPYFQEIRDIFSFEGATEERLLFFLELLLKGIDDFLPFSFSLPNYPLEKFRAEAEDFFKYFDTPDGFTAQKNYRALLESGFSSEILRLQIFEAVSFLQSRLGEEHKLISSRSPKFFRPSEMEIEQLRHADLFKLRSLRLQAQAITTIVEQLPSITPAALAPIEQTEMLVKSADAYYYPAGGIDELSRKGSIEMLLPSELAFIDEKIGSSENAPDLFSIRFLENELLYFKRNDGHIRRKRFNVNFVIFNFKRFRIKQPEHLSNLETYIDALLLKTVKELFKLLHAEGITINIFWMQLSAEDKTDFKTPELLESMMPAQKAQGIFNAELLTSLAGLRKLIETNRNAFTSWLIFTPPGTLENLLPLPFSLPAKYKSEFAFLAEELQKIEELLIHTFKLSRIPVRPFLFEHLAAQNETALDEKADSAKEAEINKSEAEINKSSVLKFLEEKFTIGDAKPVLEKVDARRFSHIEKLVLPLSGCLEMMSIH